VHKLSKQVQRVIKAENISLEELATMLRKAAITTHSRGNRRFHSWIFDMSDTHVDRMTLDELIELDKPGSLELTVHDDCPECDGEGCRLCHWVGEVVIHYYKAKK
jgi:hypothetical protein